MPTSSQRAPAAVERLADSARYRAALARLSTQSEGMEQFRATANRMLKGLLPSEKMTPFEWAAKYRKLAKKAAAVSGAWDNDKTPYLKEILEAYADPTIENIAWQAGIQLAKTEGFINNIIGYHIHMDPCVMLMVMPNAKMLDKYRSGKLLPMFEATPAFYDEGRVQRSKPGSSKTNKHRISFDNGDLLFGSGASKSDASSSSVRVVIVDEAARMPIDPVEGNTLPLFEGRATTYVGRGKKFVVTSTPTDENCPMHAEYMLGDRRKWKVPCPHCHAYQILEWSNMEWDKTELEDDTRRHHPETAWYKCSANGCRIEERHRYAMNLLGYWEATAISTSRKRRSYHLSTLYSPFVTFEYIVQTYLDKMASPDGLGMMAFKNQILGEIFTTGSSLRPAHTKLMERAEKSGYSLGEVPSAVGFITMGVDVQEIGGGYLDASVWGFGPNNQRWLIDCIKIHGHYTDPKTWETLDHVRRKVYRDENGRELRAMRVCVDSGYGISQPYVWDYARKWQLENVYALKSSSSRTGPLLQIGTTDKDQQGRKAADGIYLLEPNVHAMKLGLYSSLNTVTNPADPFYIHLPKMEEALFKQLTAESLVTVGGVQKFIQKYDRNELLDTCNYAFSGAVHMNIERYTPQMWAELYRLQGVEAPSSLNLKDEKPQLVEVHIDFRVMVDGKWHTAGDVIGVSEANAISLCDVPNPRAHRVADMPDAPKPAARPAPARKPAIPKGFRRKAAAF